jgi:hypothetical protein
MKSAVFLLITLFPLGALTSAAVDQSDALPEPAEHVAKLTIELMGADTALYAKKLAQIDAALQSAARENDRRLVVEFWAIADPAAALRYVENSSLRPRAKQALMESLVRGWTRSSPEHAWQWSRQQPRLDQLDLLRVALETAASAAPDKGFAWLQSLAAQAPQPPPDFQDHAFSFFIKLCEAGDYATVRRLIDQLPPGELREQLLFSTTERMARYALEDSASWSLSRAAQPDAYSAQAAVSLEKVRRNFDEAFTWVLAIDDAAVRPQLVRTIAGEAIAREPTPANAEKILAKLSGERERHGAYAALASTADLVRSSPALVIDNAWKIAALQDRRMALVRGYSAWYEADQEAALRHLARSSEGRDEDRKVIERFLKQPDES